MLVLRQSRHDVLLLVVVVLLSIAANLPDQYAFVNRNVLIGILVVIVCISLVRYVRASLVVVTAVLVLGANLPREWAEEFGVNRLVLLATLCTMVAVAVFNHFVRKVPTGEETEQRAKSVYGARALFNAVTEGRIKSVQALIRSGANVNIRTLSGKTPLMAASFWGYSDIVQMLLNAGARTNATDAEGNTALSIARHKGHSTIVAYLKMAGADDQPQFLDVAALTRADDYPTPEENQGVYRLYPVKHRQQPTQHQPHDDS